VQADGSFVSNNLGVPVGSRIFYSYTLTNSVGSTSELVDLNGAWHPPASVIVGRR
jgi:hypothetical protein